MDNDFSEIQRILDNDVEHNYTKHYNLKSGDVFVEGGSYIGRWAKLVSQQVGKSGKIIAIEPSPANFNILKQVTAGMKNVVLVNKALWNKKESVKFFVNTKTPIREWTGHRIKTKVLTEERKNRGVRVVEVEADTLDNILEDLKISNVDLLAWDIEGAEMKALEGLENSLTNGIIKHFALCFYHTTEREPIEATKDLQEYGYNIIEFTKGVIYGGKR